MSVAIDCVEYGPLIVYGVPRTAFPWYACTSLKCLT